MKQRILGVIDVLALIATIFLWFAIEGVLIVSWLLIMDYSVGGWLPLIIVNTLLIFVIVKRNKLRKKLLIIVSCITAIGVLVAGITFMSITNYSRDFTSEKWKNYPAGRSGMVEDLEKEYDFVGMSKAEVVELLGEPNNISQFLYGHETYEYYNHHKYDVGGRYLVNFDMNGVAFSAYYHFD